MLLTLSLVYTLLAVGAPTPARADSAATAPAASTAPATTPSPTGAIVELMGSDDPEKRTAAAVRIIEIGSEEAFKSLTEVLNQKNSDDAKAAICQAIINTGSTAPPFIEPLLEIARNTDSSLGTMALKALGHYRDPEVAEQVTTIRTRREHKLMLEALRESDRRLYELTPDNEKSAYIEDLLNRPLSVRRLTALEILHRDLSSRKPEDSLLKRVRALLNDENPAVVRAAVVVLRDLRQKSDARLLREVLHRQDNPEVRETVFDALGYLADPDSIPVCAEALDSPNEKEAALAASSIGRLTSHNPGPGEEARQVAVEALLSRSADPIEDTTLRSNVIEAMTRIAVPDFAPTFVKHADPEQEPLPAVRQLAIRGLIAIESTAHLDVILEAMTSDPDKRVRETAAEATGRIGRTTEVLQRLRERLEDESEAVVKAVWASYLAVIARLAPEQRMEILETWNGDDPNTLARRVELLSHIARLSDIGDQQRMRLIEEAGDGWVTLKRLREAGTAYGRALDLAPADEEGHRRRLAVKALEAYLSIPDPTRALEEASKLQAKEVRASAADLLHTFASGLNDEERRAFLELLAETIPDRFGEEWAGKFAALLPKPSTRPATGTAPAG